MSAHERRYAKWKAKQAGRRVRSQRPKADIDHPLGYLFTWYLEIRAQQARGQHHEPIGYPDIVAYREAYDLRGVMDSFDVETLVQIDIKWREIVPEKTRPPAK